MTLTAKAIEFMSLYPRPSMYGSGLPAGWTQGDTWHNLCASFSYRFADWMGWAPAPAPPYGSASVVAGRSGTLRTDWRNAPVGAWHFWGKPTNDGHVGQDMEGGGSLLAMGYKGVPWMVGANCGFNSVPATTALLPAAWPYIGWATNYAGGRIDLSGFASGGTTPIPNSTIQNPLKGTDSMYELIPGPVAKTLVGPQLTSDGKPVMVALGDDDWKLMVAAKYNLRELTGDEEKQYYRLIAQVLPRPTSGGTTAPVIDYAKLAAELDKIVPNAPTEDAIAAEVIRQMKLPGN